jgi:hypothetical protein
MWPDRTERVSVPLLKNPTGASVVVDSILPHWINPQPYTIYVVYGKRNRNSITHKTESQIAGFMVYVS